MSRDPLTERIARQLRDIDPDPKAWIEGPAREPWHRFDGWVLLLMCVATAAAFAAAGFLLCRWFSC